MGGTFVSCNHYGASVLLAFVFCGLFFFGLKLKMNVKTVIFISFVLRLSSALIFPSEPFSDYLKYHETALSLIRNTPYDTFYVTAFPHTLHYSYFVALIYRIFGENPLAVYIVNAFLGTLTVYVVYKLTNVKMAFLFGIFPASVLYTSLMATEIPYTLLFFCALYFALKEKSFISGIFAGLMNLIRPTGIIFLIAYTIYVMFFERKSGKPKKLILMLLAYICITSVSGGLNIGYNLFVGMNLETLGRWNAEDYNLAMSFSDVSKMNEFMLKASFQRFIDNGLWGNIRLLCSKFALTWGGGSLICYYLSLNNFFVSLTQGFHLFIAFYSLKGIFIKKVNMLAILTVLGSVALYLITETMERYVYAPLITIILISGAMKGNYGMFFKDLMADINAVLERDPASKSRLEVYFLSPGVKALRMHRYANFFWRNGFEFIAKSIAMRARKKTGIEIHPAAKIGKGVMIDHGMGVVIGETAVVGDNCTIYQNVTLGGTGKDTGKRHPTIGNNVMIGSGAKVLGPFTVGDNSKIAANAVVLSEVPPDCTCVGVPARIVKQNNKRVCDQMDQTHIPDPVSQELCKLLMRIEALEDKVISKSE